MSKGPATALAVVFGLAGSALAVASIVANNYLEEQRQSKTKEGVVIAPKRKQTFSSIQPRGLHWWSVSADFEGANDMPRVLQISHEDEKYWESLPVHSPEGDPFALHENFVEALVHSKRCNASNLEQIMRDIPRTFPDEDYFKDTDVQDTMRRVLMAVCVEYPDIGYVQSMNFLAGFLFLHTKTEDGCFALFRRLMSHPRMRMEEMYKPGLPLLFRALNALSVLTEKYAPRCAEKFKEVGLDYIMFAQTWFMTLFTYSMDWANVGPIWDVFFERGWEGPLRIALFFIRENSSKILSGDFDTISAIFREASVNAPFDVCARSLMLPFDDNDHALIAAITADV